jgi:translation elongation factor EF-G
MNEIREYLTSAFQRTTNGGPLYEKNMRGICFNVQDVTFTSKEEISRLD